MNTFIKTAAFVAAFAACLNAQEVTAFDIGGALKGATSAIGGVVKDPVGTVKGTIKQIQRDPLSTVVNPMQHVNPTGLPQPGDLAEIAILHPDQMEDYLKDPTRLVGSPLATAIFSARGRARNGATFAVPQDVRNQLSPFFPAWVFDRVRGSTNWGVMNGLLQTVALGLAEAHAITLIDTVVFKSEQEVHNAILWAHELEHVLQYESWGVPEFATRYTQDHNSVENQAYAKERQVASLINNRNPWNAQPTRTIASVQPQMGQMCVVMNAGSCPMPMSSPIGSPCYCSDMYGRQWWGNVR